MKKNPQSLRKSTNEKTWGNRTRGIESQDRLTEVRGEEGGGECLKEGEGVRQGTYMKEPWTWTMGWGLTMEVGWRGAKGEIIGTTVKAKNKIKSKKTPKTS